MSSLLQPIIIGDKIPVRNRVVMSALTRNRCLDDNKPGPAQVKHYSDRARDGVGLIMSEGILIDWTGSDWKHAPFMINEDHAKAWRAVTDAVHRQGGVMYFQAWHAGRCQHDELRIMKEKGGVVLAPSAVRASGGKYHDLPGQPGHTENVKAIEDPRAVVETYRRSALLAQKAGFDGIELLAQGYCYSWSPVNEDYRSFADCRNGTGVIWCINFLARECRANRRTDKYGGSVENRCRFPLEVVDTISEVFGGPEHICVKINPTDVMNDSVVDYEEMKQTYTFLITGLVARKVGIINIGRRGAETKAGSGTFFAGFARPDEYPLPPGFDPIRDFGRLVKYPGSSTLLLANHDYTVQEAAELIAQEKLDLISFGRPFICNPDIVARIRHGQPFAINDRGSTVNYGPSKSPDEDYNDWPSIQTGSG